MTDHIGEATQKVIDLEALEKLADEATQGPWEARQMPHRAHCMKWIVGQPAAGNGHSIAHVKYPDGRDAAKDAAFIAAANPATIKALIALVKDAWAERDQLEQNIIDASNGRFPPQGQADPDDEIDGLAHMVYGLRKERALLDRNGEGEG